MLTNIQQFIRKNMSAIIIIIITVIYVTTMYLIVAHKATDHYATTAVITEVNHTDDYIVAINHSRTFVIYGADDWHEGDCLSILMDRKRTAQITDDEIVDYYYTDLTRTEDNLWIVHTKER